MGLLSVRRYVVSIGVLVGSLAFPSAAPAADLDHILFQTIRRGDTDSLRSLLRQGTPVEIRADDGTTPLLYAALRGNAESVELLLERGADPDAANRIGATALLWGAGDQEKVRLLLAHGADPNPRSALGNTPLLAASAGPDSHRSVELLVAAGADIEAVNERGSTALANAAFTGSVATVRLLLARGADPSPGRRSTRSTSPLLLAASRGDRELVEVLLQHGADPNESDGDFAGNAVNISLLSERPEIAEILVAHGGDLNVSTPVASVPPILLAAYTETGDTSIAQLMLERGVDVNATNVYNETALTWARRRGHPKLIELLQKAGATEPETTDKKKDIPRRRIRLHAGNQDRLLKTSIRKSLALLQTSSDAFLKNRESCVSCHHQNLPGVALAWARDRGFAIDQNSVDRMVDRQVRSWTPRIDHAYQMDRPVPVPPRLLGWGLLGFGALGYPRDDLTDAMVWYLGAIQRADGHWIPGLLRPPMGGGEIAATVLAMRGLQLYPLEGRTDEMAERVERARRWLLAAEPRLHQERVFKLLGLSWSGSSGRDLEHHVEELLAEQREDGGWSQLPGMESDAWATGESLVALAVAGDVPTSHPAYRRGMTYLLSTQFDDGSWFVKSRTWPFQPHFDSRFPHGRDQWVSAAATAWATMALTLGVKPFAAVVVGGARPDAGERESVRRPVPAAKREGTEQTTAGPPPASVPRVDFARRVQPVLERSCLGCHGDEKPKASLRLTSRAFLLKGGESGESAIVPGSGGESLLVRLVSGQVEDMEMPPLPRREQYPALTRKEIDGLRAWIDAGAPWPDAVTLEARKSTTEEREASSGGARKAGSLPSRTSRF